MLKNYYRAGALCVMLAMTVTVQAEGFFSGLFSGSKGGADFKSMMAHVPADTSYIITNKNPIPDEVMEFHMSRSKNVMEMFKKLPKPHSKDADSKLHEFFSALTEDYMSKLSDNKFEETGLSKKAHSLIYGIDMFPVIRIGFKDKEKLMDMLKRAEEKSGYKVELAKCGDFDCLSNTNKTEDMGFTVVMLKDHLAAALYSTEKKAQITDHLIGKSMPEKSYAISDWETFLKDNAYQGYGDGFIDLKSIFSKARPMIAAGMQAKVDEKEVDACMNVAEDNINNLSKILLGTKDLQKDSMEYELLFATSPEVSSTLQTIPNENNIAQRAENAIFDFGINMNFMKLRDALTQYANFLIKSGETHKCTAIKPQEIRKGVGGMAMLMNMGLTQFKSVYASVSDIELDDKMQPKNVDALISIGSDDPAGLIGMVGMMSPKLMGFQVPADGKTVKLPDGAIPSRGQPVPDIYLSRSAKSLNVMVGNDKPALVEFKNDTPLMSFSSIDGKRYLEKLSSIMKAMPQGKGEMPDMEVLQSMGTMSGKVYSETSADKRGLIVNYKMQY